VARLVNIPLLSRVRLLAALYMFVVYSSGVFSPGAWSDDYAALLDPQATGLHAIKDGRLLYGGLIQLMFSLFNSIGGLLFIRLLGLLGLILLNDLVINQLYKRSESLLIPITTSAAFTLPSFQFSAHWAIAFVMSWAAYLAVLGFVIFRKHSLKNYLLGLVLLLFSVLLYPLMSFFVVSFVYAEILIDKKTLRSISLKSAEVLFFLVSGLGLGALVSFTYLRLNSLDANPRVSFVALGDIFDKIFWFLSRPFALSFRPFLIDSPSLPNILIFLFCITTAIILLFRLASGSWLRAIEQVFVLFIFLALSILPLLLAAQNQIDLRFIASNTWIVLFTFIYLFGSIFREASKPWVSCIAVLLLFTAFTLNSRYFSFIRPIFLANQTFIAGALENCTEEQIAAGLVIVGRTTPWSDKPLIGFYSQMTDFQSEWVPVGALEMYLEEHQLPHSILPMMDVYGVNDSRCPVRMDDYGR